MATKLKATKTPKAKTERKSRMTMQQKYQLMEFVKNADPKTPDATLAAEASAGLGRTVAQLTVRSYRKGFGIASVSKPGVGSLYARIAQLEKYILTLGADVPPPGK